MELFDREFQEWIDQHGADDTASLRLRYANAHQSVKEAILQIECRAKADNKFARVNPLGGAVAPAAVKFAPRWFPTALSVEQATSASVSCFHAAVVAPVASLLDMTMGLGVDAAAIASLSAASVTAIERDARLCQFAKANYQHINNLDIINADSVDWLRTTGRSFDAIFIDPARRDNLGRRVFNIHDCTPDVAEIISLMFDHAHDVYVKLSPMLDISATIADLKHVAKVYIVEERGDVRELFVHLNRDTVSVVDDVEIEVVSAIGSFAFSRRQEAEAHECYAEPTPGAYLYEPSPAIMKAAPFRLLCSKFDLAALHPNTHLYLSGKAIDGFPGKRYHIVEVIPYSSKHIKRFAKTYPAASVSVRNFPCTAAVLRNKLKVNESDNLKVVGATLKGGAQVMIVAQPTLSWPRLYR